jgi:hypothetical protein
MTARIKNAGGGNPPATTTRPVLSYRQPALVSRASLLEQAAEVLCLLAFFPLTETARTVLFGLLEHRIERAYGGGQR